MELYKELLSKEIGRLVLEWLGNEKIDYAEHAERDAVAALEKIKAAVGDGSLSDFDCVEKIICILEESRSGGGGRHDFG